MEPMNELRTGHYKWQKRCSTLRAWGKMRFSQGSLRNVTELWTLVIPDIGGKSESGNHVYLGP